MIKLEDKFPRHKLTFGPTPIEHLPRLSATLGGKVQIYAKRDDCNSGLAMGGNKLRKLEYIVPDAIASGAMYSSFLSLFPPRARPELQSSRLA